MTKEEALKEMRKICDKCCNNQEPEAPCMVVCEDIVGYFFRSIS